MMLAVPSNDEFLTQTQKVATSQLALPTVDSDVHAKLISLIDSGVTYQIRRDQKEVHVGRHPGMCEIVVEDKRASSKHLRIYRDDAFRYFVQELGSNGAFCNDHQMAKGDTRALHHGDAISICVHHQRHPDRPEDQQPFAAYIFRLADHCSDPVTAGMEAAASIGKNGDLTTAAAAVQQPPVVEAQRARAAMVAAAKKSQRLVTEQWINDNWDMRTVLGSGNFSEVRLGVQVKKGESQCAVKVIDKNRFYTFQSKRESQLSLQSEADMLMQLDHPGIIKFFEWFETEEKLFIAMEFLGGGDLLQFILEKGCFREAAGRRLFRRICSAVNYLHDRNIVHRDLKPENILLTCKEVDRMEPKLADFGLARMNMKTKDCKTFCGTPHYFAPEVIHTFRDRDQGQPGGYGKQADMWSLGVILYIMLSGIPPFEEEGLYEQILDGKYEFDVSEWEQVSPEAKELVRQLMTVNPKGRLTIQQTVVHKWFTLDDQPSSPDPAKESDDVPMEAAAKRRRTDDWAMGVESTAPAAPASARLGA